MFYSHLLTSTNHIYVLVVLVILLTTIYYLPQMYMFDTSKSDYMIKIKTIFKCINESNTTRILFALFLGSIMYLGMLCIAYFRQNDICCIEPGIIQMESDVTTIPSPIKPTANVNMDMPNTQKFNSMRY